MPTLVVVFGWVGDTGGECWKEAFLRMPILAMNVISDESIFEQHSPRGVSSNKTYPSGARNWRPAETAALRRYLPQMTFRNVLGVSLVVAIGGGQFSSGGVKVEVAVVSRIQGGGQVG